MKITTRQAGQRIDNYLFSQLKGVPKSRIYRALRAGEVRVNQKRIKPDYRLQLGDIIRVPPLSQSAIVPKSFPPNKKLLKEVEENIIYEDKYLLIINKPYGLAVHGGSGISHGVVEILRYLRPKANIALAHRLDRDTSGCLIIAKTRPALIMLHEAFRLHRIKKEYLLVVAGKWPNSLTSVNQSLLKYTLSSGERRVQVNDLRGKPAKTDFRCLHATECWSLLLAKPLTGRTHQLRVHTAASGFPILGEEKYETRFSNQLGKELGIKRLMLHASVLRFSLPELHVKIDICATLDQNFSPFIKDTVFR